jgi:hypothetical protein
MSITISPLSIEYHTDACVIEVNTEFDEGLAFGLEKMLTRLFGYYHYKKVTLRLNSPGGNLTALKYILSVIEQARLNGKEVHTDATFQAASAGALLLSHGQVGTRSVKTLTHLLYHHTRVSGATPTLTSSAADMLSTVMKRMDAKLIGGLVVHISRGFGGVSAVCNEGLARCHNLVDRGASIAQELDLESSKQPKWLGKVTKVYRECEKRNSLEPLERFLEQRFTPDTSMELHEAYALLLIDRVHLAPSLPARAFIQVDQIDDRPHLLKLAA